MRLQRFFGGCITRSYLIEEGQVNRLRRTYSGRSLFLRSQTVFIFYHTVNDNIR